MKPGLPLVLLSCVYLSSGGVLAYVPFGRARRAARDLSRPRSGGVRAFRCSMTTGPHGRQQVERGDAIGTYAAAALSMLWSLASPRPASAWCGKPFPPEAYRLRFNEGLVPFKLMPDAQPADLYLRVVGDENKEKKAGTSPVILIAGGPGFMHSYLETLEPLSFSDRRVIAFDPLGSGASAPLPASFTPDGKGVCLEVYAELVSAQLTTISEFLDLKGGVHLYGHGAGAAAALQYAASLERNTTASMYVKSLTLASPFVVAEGKSALQRLYEAQGKTVPICVVETVEGTEAPGSANDLTVEASWASSPLLAQVRGPPVFITYGSADVVTADFVQDVAKTLQKDGASSVIVKEFVGAGHLPHIDKETEYVEWLAQQIDFLDGKRGA